MDDHYDSRPGRLLVLHLCLRCGAEVGVRRIHDEWHDRHEQLPPRITQTLPADQMPSCPRCAGRVWLDRTCYRCGGQMPDAEGQP